MNDKYWGTVGRQPSAECVGGVEMVGSYREEDLARGGGRLFLGCPLGVGAACSWGALCLLALQISFSFFHAWLQGHLLYEAFPD